MTNVGGSFNSFDIQFYKCTFEMMLIGLLYVRYGGINVTEHLRTDRDKAKWVMVVAVFGCIANYLAITGIEHIYLSIASLLNNTLPIFVIVVAYFMLNERLNRI